MSKLRRTILTIAAALILPFSVALSIIVQEVQGSDKQTSNKECFSKQEVQGAFIAESMVTTLYDVDATSSGALLAALHALNPGIPPTGYRVVVWVVGDNQDVVVISLFSNENCLWSYSSMPAEQFKALLDKHNIDLPA